MTEAYRPISAKQNRLELQPVQANLDNLSNWAYTWQLCSNANKWEVLLLVVRTGNTIIRCHGSDDMVVLQKSEMEMDLGVIIDCALKFSRLRNPSEQIAQDTRSHKVVVCTSRLSHSGCCSLPYHEHTCSLETQCGHLALRKIRKILESVLRGATKFILSLCCLSYQERLARVEIPSMAYRRARGDMIKVFLCMHELYKMSSSILQLECETSTRGHPFQLKKW